MISGSFSGSDDRFIKSRCSPALHVLAETEDLSKRNELTGEAITIKLGSVRGSLIRQTVMSQTIVDPNSAEGVNSANNELLKDEIFELDTKYMSSSINAMEEYAIAEIEKRTINELEGGQ